MRTLVLLLSLGLLSLNAFAQNDGTGGVTLEPRDGFYDKIHGNNRRVVPYPHMRESDVTEAWRVWREIDFREKVNQVFFYPLTPTNGRKNYIEILRTGILTDLIVTPFNSENDDFKVQLTTSDFAKIGTRRDTQWVPSPEPPYEPVQKIIDEPFKPDAVKAVRLKEDWFFDRQRSVMECRIIGMLPMMQQFNASTGDFEGMVGMAWIYFPQARHVMSREEVYNTKNYAQRITFDDLFMKRMFSSRILKVDNVHDRYIADYTTGLDALLVGEEIKEQIFLFEHDMWEQ